MDGLNFGGFMLTKQEMQDRIVLLDQEMQKCNQEIEQRKTNLAALFGGKSELQYWINQLETKEAKAVNDANNSNDGCAVPDVDLEPVSNG